MTASTLLHLYAQQQVLLGATFVLFRGARALTTRLKRDGGYARWTRLGQALVVAAVLLPAAFSLIPRRHLPIVGVQVDRPLSETAPRARYPRARRLRDHRPVTTPTALSSRPSLWSELARKISAEAGLWLLALGACLFALRLARQLQLLLRLAREGIIVRRIHRVSIVVSTTIAVPFSTLLGRRAYVLVPGTLLGSARDYRVALKHELQHHRQRDTAWALVIELAVVLFHANPAIWLWRKEIVELQEFSCDEALLGRGRVSTHDYGSCLVRVAEAALGAAEMRVGTACMAAGSRNPKYFKSFLLRRVQMFQTHKQSRGPGGLGSLLGTFALLATVAVAYGAQQQLRAEPPRAPNPGRAVFDPHIQSIAESELRKAVHDLRAESGFVLVSEPSSGRLLAVANISSNPRYQSGSWALSYLMEPASAIKGIIAASAIEQETTTADSVHDCEKGNYRYGNHVYHDWKKNGFDHLTTAETVINSSNICGIKIAETLGTEGVARTLTDFGFGPGGSTKDFPEALPGFAPPPSPLPEDEYIPQIATGYTGVAAFNISPLEMVQAYGAIANGGRLMKPIEASEPDSSERVVRTVLSEHTVADMKAMLARVVTEGTGSNARSALYTTAGKTSTAYHPADPDHDSLGGQQAIAGFVGFAPVENPRVAIYVGIVHPTNTPDHSVHGNGHAAPVFRKVTERVLQYLKVTPDRPRL